MQSKRVDRKLYKYCIVLGPARTGTTLLMNVINAGLSNKSFYGEYLNGSPFERILNVIQSIDDYSLWLKQMCESLQDTSSHIFCNEPNKKLRSLPAACSLWRGWRIGVNDIKHPFYKPERCMNKQWENINLEHLDAIKDDILLNFFQPKDMVCGYKQIMKDPEICKHMIEQALRLIKNIYFIIPTRDSNATYASWKKKGWKDWIKMGKDVAEKRMNAFSEMYKINKSRVFCIDLKDFSNPESKKLKMMFDFIGLDFNKDKVRKAISEELTH